MPGLARRWLWKDLDMPVMQWDSSLDIGVGSMNQEHQEILDAMNRVYDALQAGQAGEKINRLIEQLGAITARHFKDEEAYMASIGFPGLKVHALIHVDLLERFGKHAAAIREAGGRAGEDFFQFLKYWLSVHIKGIDRKYGAYASTGARAA